jgi:hypothetical protein
MVIVFCNSKNAPGEQVSLAAFVPGEAYGSTIEAAEYGSTIERDASMHINQCSSFAVAHKRLSWASMVNLKVLGQLGYV